MAPPPRTKKALDIKAEMSRVRDMYKETKATKPKINVLLLGEMGSGKTYLMSSAPGITHIDCFDPGATFGLREYIEAGQILADTTWEHEDPLQPSAFLAWEKKTKERIDAGYFDQFDNYMLDSTTTFSAAIMNQIMKNAGMPGAIPRFTHDYGPQKQAVYNWIRTLLNLPCNVFITGHLKTIIDEKTKKVTYRFMTTGQASIIIPTLFDEVWVMSPKEASGGVKYRILTKATGEHLARSRLSASGKLDAYEDANLTTILKKGGLLDD